MRIQDRMLTTVLALALLMAAAACACAQSTPDPVGLDVVTSGHGKVRLTVTAGESGAPAGFRVRWMTAAQFASLGNQWPTGRTPTEGWVDFTGVGTLNTWGTAQVDFQLASRQSLDVEIGDTRAESGVSGMVSDELTSATEYVLVALALGSGDAVGPVSITRTSVTSAQGENCTFTIGYWKNHPSAWPVSSLVLGSASYTASQLLAILAEPVVGNGLISLAHQLIGTRLNIANGASPTSIAASIAAADALIGGLVGPPVGPEPWLPRRRVR